MKYAILSDIHSNLEAFQAVIKKCKDTKINNFLFQGDIVGYGPNPRECVDLLIDLKCKAIVKGNHDVMAYDVITSSCSENAKKAMGFTIDRLTKSQKKWLESLPFTSDIENFIITHACLYVPQCWFYLFNDSTALDLTFMAMIKEKKKLCFVGHSHIPMVFHKTGQMRSSTFPKIIADDFTIINNGSVGQPRDFDNRACFITYDSETKELETERVVYDIEKTMKKIRDNKLPLFLGERLFKGV